MSHLVPPFNRPQRATEQPLSLNQNTAGPADDSAAPAAGGLPTIMASGAYNSESVGIVLGTTYGCVAVWEGGCVNIVADGRGEAKHEFVDEDSSVPIGLIFAKRKEDADRNYVPNPGFARDHVYVDYEGNRRSCCVGDAMASALIQMKKIAEARTGRGVKNAVIVVPSYFDGSARQATRDRAATKAGIHVLRITDEHYVIAARRDSYVAPDEAMAKGAAIQAAILGGESADINFCSPDQLPSLGVPLPANGGQYELDEAVEIILNFPYRSKERAAVVRLMVEGELLPLKSAALYDRIKMAESAKNERITHRNATKDASLLGLKYEGDYVHPDIRQKVSWKGSILLSVIPSCRRMKSRVVDSIINAENLETIDICALIGNTDLVTTNFDTAGVRSERVRRETTCHMENILQSNSGHTGNRYAKGKSYNR